MQLSFSRPPDLHDFIGQEEEIVSPGSPSSGGNSMDKTLRGHDGQLDTLGHFSHQKGYTDAGISSQNNDKLHPLGVLMPEIEGTYPRGNQTPTGPLGRGVQTSNLMAGESLFGVMADSSHAADTWPETLRRNALSELDWFQQDLDFRHSSRGGVLELLSRAKHGQMHPWRPCEVRRQFFPGLTLEDKSRVEDEGNDTG